MLGRIERQARNFLSRVSRRNSPDVTTEAIYSNEVIYKTFSGQQVPIKINYKDGEEIGRAALFSVWRPKRYLEEEYTPSFAKGRLYSVGGGDYKSVFIDEGAGGDIVLKRYNWHSYHEPEAKRKAEVAAQRIALINNLVTQIAPGYVLPFEMIVEGAGENFDVWERQQRAFVVDKQIFDPKTAEKLQREARIVSKEGTKRVEEELFRLGIARLSMLDIITDDFSITEIHWDAITSHLVSLDIVDKVDIEYFRES